MELKERLKRLPLPLQVLVNMTFVGLLAVDLAIPDILPFVDEILLGWLVYSGVAAMISSRGKQTPELPGAATVDVRDQQASSSAASGLDEAMKAAAEAELEAIEGAPF